ncbi:glycosyltransferase family 4 protein [Bradyrhizobium sp. dw_78]|uniref:glycosyltransferase family 4 protein n=1 Tax=Bradyrhizobium sp. dw_78 TaxID=2719793 RepID=UPI001BD25094|nr:glycosyltransferase family 4 protein [Bradyrhizobium sp. dw_78]
MQQTEKIVVVSQHYPPDHSTTAAIMAAIARHLTSIAPVVVLSGMPGSASGAAGSDQPAVIEIKNRLPEKAALIRRATAEMLFTLRTFVALLLRLRKGDVALTVTAPFMLPYAVAAAARLKRARSVLIMHDLFPDVLVMAGLLKPSSIVARAIRGANALMFRALHAVVIIGRDTEPLLLRYKGLTRDKICFIPNWATLAPGVRPIEPDNPYRRPIAARFIVGLSGNLGFTHDPVVVFEAARLLRDDPEIHFLLSGWGIGFEQMKQMQASAKLPNVTLVDRVPEKDLERFLSAANAWLIPYRKDLAGVSVPSRFYNLLAIGRPVILVSEAGAEAALTVTEHGLGWVVQPGDAAELARAIRLAASSDDASIGERAVLAARRFNFSDAMSGYAALMRKLLRSN